MTEMTWNTITGFVRSSGNADDIVAWVNANGGKARYVSLHSRDHRDHEARIVITGPKRPLYVAPGDTVVMGEWFNHIDEPMHRTNVREFTVRKAND